MDHPLYPIVQRLMAAEGMTEYWRAKGRPDFAENWRQTSLALQRRLLADALQMRLFGPFRFPRPICVHLAGVVGGYCKDIGGPHVA